MNTEAKFSALIVDDETEACKNLSYLLQHQAKNTIDLVGTANTTYGAEALISKHKPDVVFLDIDMPKENAFQFLERINPVDFEVIFITAYDMFAIKAFKLNAIDYIVKPIDSMELTNAIGKLREKLVYKKVFRQYTGYGTDLLHNIATKRQPQYVTLRDGSNIEVVDFEKLILIEAKGAYSKITFLKNEVERQLVMSYSISEYEELLPDTMFYRVHKSFLLNCKHIEKIVKDEHPYAVTNTNLNIPIGRRRYASFMSFLRGNVNEA